MAKAAGVQLQGVVLLDPTWVDWSSQLFGAGVVKEYKHHQLSTPPLPCADVIVSNVEPPASLDLWRHVDKILVCQPAVRRQREVPLGFTQVSVHANHLECGGVTDGSWQLELYKRESSGVHIASLMLSVPRDLSSVVDTTVGMGLECPQPKVIVLNPFAQWTA